MPSKTPGQLYYETMMDFTGGTSRETGFRLPEWVDLDLEGRRMHNFCAKAIIAAQPDPAPERYLICFDDPDMKPEHFTDRETAIKRLAALRESCDCDLFGEIAWEGEGK